MRKRGEITVFLSLILSVLLIFVMRSLEDIKGHVVTNNISIAANAAIRSSFAEYNKYLFDRFHLLYLDPSYKTQENSIETVKSHFSNYMLSNIQSNSGYISGDKYSISEIDITDICRANDDDWYDLYCQIDKYVQEEYPDLIGSSSISKYSKVMFGNNYNPREGASRIGELEYIIYGDMDMTNIVYAQEDYLSYIENSIDVAEGSYLTYREYINGVIDEMDARLVLSRVIDLVNEEIRNNGSPAFNLSECIYSMSVVASISNGTGKEYTINRIYKYAKV